MNSAETVPSTSNKPSTKLTTTGPSAEDWLLLRVGSIPKTSLGWFRCGVGFYNKKEYGKSIECFEKAVQLDPMNVRLSFYTFSEAYCLLLTPVLLLFFSSTMLIRLWLVHVSP